MKIISADFKTTATAPAGWPAADLPEFAFAGRSNVGKSSMINKLVARKNLVRVSNQPGRTRTLNFFDIRLEELSGARHALRFCDLPGYGFARVSHSERASWRKMIERYLIERQSLRGVVCIVDAEVGATSLDRELMSWIRSIPREAVVVATKTDRLGKARRKPHLTRIAKQLGTQANAITGFSAIEGLGVDEVWSRLLELTGTTSTAGSTAPGSENDS